MAPVNEDSQSKKSEKLRDKGKTTKKDASSSDERNKSGSHTLPDFMFGVNAFFCDVEEDQRKRLTRYLLAYPFDRHLAMF